MHAEPRSIPSSILFCGVVAIGGQFVVNHISSRRAQAKEDEDDSWMASKWSPLKKLSDEEYTHMMGEKLLSVEADIALIDERVAQLRAEQANAGAGASETQSTK